MTQAAQHEITQLQIKVAFQEDTIDTLSEALADQQGRIETLERKLSKLVERVKQLQPDEVGDPGQEPPPPHY